MIRQLLFAVAVCAVWVRSRCTRKRLVRCRVRPRRRRARSRRAKAPRPTATSRSRSGWARRTRRCPRRPRRYDVQTVVEGVNGAWFQFLPDGRILVGEKNGRIRIVSKDGKLSDPLGGMPSNMYDGRTEPVLRAAGQPLRHQPDDLPGVRGAAGRRRRRETAHAHSRACREREDLIGRHASRRRQRPAGRRGHRRTCDSGEGRHAAHRDDRPRRSWHQVGGLDAAAAGRQPDGQGAPHQR